MALKDVINYAHTVIKEYNNFCKFLDPLCRKYFEQNFPSNMTFYNWEFKENTIMITYTYEHFVGEEEYDSVIVDIEDIIKLMD